MKVYSVVYLGGIDYSEHFLPGVHDLDATTFDTAEEAEADLRAYLRECPSLLGYRPGQYGIVSRDVSGWRVERRVSDE